MEGQEITWTSSDETVATVDENGLVTAAGAGTTTITATVAGTSVTDTCTVVVEVVEKLPEVTVESIRLTYGETETPVTETIAVESGATEQLTAVVMGSDGKEMKDQKIRWTSSDETVATIDENGLVTAVGAGTATITAAVGGKEAACVVEVSEEKLKDKELLTEPVNCGAGIGTSSQIGELSIGELLDAKSISDMTDYQSVSIVYSIDKPAYYTDEKNTTKTKYQVFSDTTQVGTDGFKDNGATAEEPISITLSDVSDASKLKMKFFANTYDIDAGADSGKTFVGAVKVEKVTLNASDSQNSVELLDDVKIYGAGIGKSSQIGEFSIGELIGTEDLSDYAKIDVVYSIDKPSYYTDEKNTTKTKYQVFSDATQVGTDGFKDNGATSEEPISIDLSAVTDASKLKVKFFVNNWESNDVPDNGKTFAGAVKIEKVTLIAKTEA